MVWCSSTLSELLADAVMIRVWKVALYCTSKDFLLFVFKADCAMMLFVTICSNLLLILLSNTEGSTVLYALGSTTLSEKEMVPTTNVQEASGCQRNLMTYKSRDPKIVLVHELVVGLK